MTTSALDIRERRTATGVSRQRLAERARCSVAYIQQLEQGLRPTSSDVLPRIEAALAELERERVSA